MKILKRPFGAYQTNCYVLQSPAGELIIDPGDGAFFWLKEVCKKPLAILNTHGHYDHVWDNDAVSLHFNAPIYIQKDDEFMLAGPFGQPPSRADVLLKDGDFIELEGFRLRLLHFPGHTPGCSAYLWDELLFSGDFLFAGSIGRYDFPYASAELMLSSLERVAKERRDLRLLPGHGNESHLDAERESIGLWIKRIRRELGRV